MKGLSFSETMVKAWLAGNKSVTRRLIRMVSRKGCCWCEGKAPYEWIEAGDLSGFDFRQPCRCITPRYRPGETVYIKETWAHVSVPDGTTARKNIIVYKADNPQGVCVPNMWKSPRFMPERFSRSHALIVSVRPERLNLITEEEAEKEGMDGHCPEDKMTWKTPREQFQALWDTLHPGSWERNDWVWRNELEWRER